MIKKEDLENYNMDLDLDYWEFWYLHTMKKLGIVPTKEEAREKAKEIIQQVAEFEKHGSAYWWALNYQNEWHCVFVAIDPERKHMKPRVNAAYDDFSFTVDEFKKFVGPLIPPNE